MCIRDSTGVAPNPSRKGKRVAGNPVVILAPAWATWLPVATRSHRLTRGDVPTVGTGFDLGVVASSPGRTESQPARGRRHSFPHVPLKVLRLMCRAVGDDRACSRRPRDLPQGGDICRVCVRLSRRCDAVPCELIADLRMWPADSPTELAQPRVADPEVMTHLVNDRPPNLLDDLGIAVAHRADGTPVDRDPVRQGAGVERRPTRQWHSLVEPQEAGRATAVLHSDGHVAHEFAQLCGYTVERLAHHHLESLGLNFDHAASVQPDAIRAALRHPLIRI